MLASTAIGAGLAASIAMCISGISSAYMAEKAERVRALKHLEQSMLVDLEGTVHGKAMMFAVMITAVVNGLSPMIASIFILSPFFALALGMVSNGTAFIASIAFSGILLFSLGIYLSKVSNENLWINGIKMLFVGVITAVASMVIAVLFSVNN